ncbi:Hypothetical protein Cp262_1737 [Corynebacterium pseudotuberculosis]|nr:Hypothetical protein Cp262_1737 [Corynebacterium pseudotuberculosis]
MWKEFSLFENGNYYERSKLKIGLGKSLGFIRLAVGSPQSWI